MLVSREKSCIASICSSQIFIAEDYKSTVLNFLLK